jgi:hypothetical protein
LDTRIKSMRVGMDVYGKGPRSDAGKWFGTNNSEWFPLATYCCDVAPEITQACKCWWSNDGDGLDDTSAIALADVLEEEIESGRTAFYESRLDRLVAVHDPGVAALEATLRSGRWFSSIRRLAPSAWDHPDLVVGMVRRFTTFLRDCGGFEFGDRAR